jgi:hypothetical protein
MVVKILENFGLYFFIVSLFIVSQLKWAEKFDYDDIDLRITICFIFSIIIYYGVMRILVAKRINTDNVSFALSFSILGIYLNSDIGMIITVAIVVIVYFIKKSKSNSLFADFWGVNNYKIKFNSSMGKLQIINNNINDLNTYRYKYLFDELMNCIIACNEDNIKSIQIESEETNKVNKIINKIFENFGIESEIVSVSEKYSNSKK